MKSQIALIVDYTAQKAAAIQGLTNPLSGDVMGVRAIWGAGQNVYTDPLTGLMVQAAPDAVEEPFTHVSDLPDAPTVEYISQSGTVMFTWALPMRLYVGRGSLATARGTMLAFYDGYEAAFAPDPMLDGLCALSYISSFKVAADPDWAWLAVELHVEEMVRY